MKQQLSDSRQDIYFSPHLNNFKQTIIIKVSVFTLTHLSGTSKTGFRQEKIMKEFD
jgi:N-acetyl-gamma-glutamylphosphate reductase